MAGNPIVEDMLAHDAITELKNRYGYMIDRIVAEREDGDIERLLDLFTEDAVVDFRASGMLGIYRGHDEIRHLYSEILPAGFAWSVHSFDNPVIVIDGDRATGRWTINGQMVLKGPEVPVGAVPFIGRYADSFLFDGRNWKQMTLGFLAEQCAPKTI